MIERVPRRWGGGTSHHYWWFIHFELFWHTNRGLKYGPWLFEASMYFLVSSILLFVSVVLRALTLI